MMKQYLFEFEPIDSFSFSGETSAHTAGMKNDHFLTNAPDASRRKSFRVETDTMPPQTTVMGAVRRVLLSHGLNIGQSSFDLACKQLQSMGVIESISPVFLLGEFNGSSVLCVPAPSAVKVPLMKEKLIPFHPCGYSAKKYCPPCWNVYTLEQLNSPCEFFLSENDIFQTYEQTITHIGKNSKVESYHLQCKCRMANKKLKHTRFGVIASLTEELKANIEPMLLPLGSKDSRFRVTCKPTTVNLGEVAMPNLYQHEKKYWCVSLLAAAYLPENWREAAGLEQAVVFTRNMRCAKSDENFRLQLIPQRLVLADKRSVFLFADAANRDDFAKSLESDPRTTCGLNRALRYEIGAPT